MGIEKKFREGMAKASAIALKRLRESEKIAGGIKKKMGQEKVISKSKAKKVGDRLGVDWSKVDLGQFQMGLGVELEHRDMTHGDMEMTGTIALAHLKEDSKYYTKLKKAGL